jgi:hypothetical protein
MASITCLLIVGIALFIAWFLLTVTAWVVIYPMTQSDVAKALKERLLWPTINDCHVLNVELYNRSAEFPYTTSRSADFDGWCSYLSVCFVAAMEQDNDIITHQHDDVESFHVWSKDYYGNGKLCSQENYQSAGSVFPIRVNNEVDRTKENPMRPNYQNGNVWSDFNGLSNLMLVL